MTFTDHILQAKKWKSCRDSHELKGLQELVVAAEQWKAEKNELFRICEENNALISVDTCTELIGRIPLGLRLDEGGVLECQIRKVLRIERAIRSLDSDNYSVTLAPDPGRPVGGVSMCVTAAVTGLGPSSDTGASVLSGSSSGSGSGGVT